jgi:peptidoglycan/LPS O-acetylase OafA/YrhL
VQNNFNFLRLLFAVFVLVTHSYKLSGSLVLDDLHSLSSGQIYFSYIGLYGLFALSGYLIYQSLERSKHLYLFYWKRILRIFPALCIVLVLTILLGAIVFEGNAFDYFQSSAMHRYFLNNVFLLKTEYDIPGIFESNPVPRMINGSLWSIPYEVMMYLSLSVLFYFSNRLKKVLVTTLFIGIVVAQLFWAKTASHYIPFLNGAYFLELAVYFYAGAMLAAWRIETIKKMSPIILVCLGLTLLTMVSITFYLSKFILLPLLVIAFGLSFWKSVSSRVIKIGDLSYGVYLYAFPIQQTLMYYFNLNVYSLMLVSLVLSMLFAYGSWHLIEKKAMLWKHNPFKKPNNSIQTSVG